MKLLIGLCLLGSLAVAQTARVLPLSSQDAQTAQDLQKQKADIEKQIETFNHSVMHRYLLTTKDTGCLSSYRVGETDQSGWSNTGIVTGSSQAWLSGSGSMVTWGGDLNCQTAEEKHRYEAEVKARVAKEEAYDKAHPRLYYVWCGTDDSFEYSTDYHYIVPKTIPTLGAGSGWITLTPNQGTLLSVPTTSLFSGSGEAIPGVWR